MIDPTYIYKMDLKDLSLLTCIPVEILKKRAEKFGLKPENGQCLVMQELIEPVNDKGLFTTVQLAKRNKVTESTIRRRFKVAGVKPEAILVLRQTGLYRLTKEVLNASNPQNSKKMQPTKAERLEGKGFSPEVKQLIEEEKLKKSWVGKQGFLCNEKGIVVAEGKIEIVSSCGVLVNGVMGDIKMLRLAE